MSVLAAFQVQLVLGQMPVQGVHVEAAAAAAAAAAAQEGAHRSALASVTHGVAEHLVDLLLRGHPPVRVGGTVHPDELWRDDRLKNKRLPRQRHMDVIGVPSFSDLNSRRVSGRIVFGLREHDSDVFDSDSDPDSGSGSI